MLVSDLNIFSQVNDEHIIEKNHYSTRGPTAIPLDSWTVSLTDSDWQKKIEGQKENASEGEGGKEIKGVREEEKVKERERERESKVMKKGESERDRYRKIE